jgi:hypothetical protein
MSVELIEKGEAFYNVYFSLDERALCTCKAGQYMGCGEIAITFHSHAGASTFVKCMMRPEFYAAARRHWDRVDGQRTCRCEWDDPDRYKDCEFEAVTMRIHAGCDEQLAWMYILAGYNPPLTAYRHWLKGKFIKEVMEHGHRERPMPGDDSLQG